MTNKDLSLLIFDFLKQAEVETVVVCAGARNASLVMALTQTDFKVVHFFEERSAAFYALGLIKTSNKPVAVMTTSGTAVAELLPAAIEATYQGLPIIFVTADRPKQYRGTGSPQSIQQVGLFSNYVEKVYDLDVDLKQFEFDWSYQKPIQLNVCFDEPLIDLASQAEFHVQLNRLSNTNSKSDQIKILNPLIIVSEISESSKLKVKEFLISSQAMIYCESLSQLNHDLELQNQLIKSTEQFITKVFSENYFDSVIRIGGVPTLRFWRDLENRFKTIPVYSFSDNEYTGLARPSEKYRLQDLWQVEIAFTKDNKNLIQKIDENLQAKKISLLNKYSMSEPAFVYFLSKQVQQESIYLGNSLPIRHWDSFSIVAAKLIYANRGANGIDGQVSTYLGWSEKIDSSFCLIGDLTALYDLAALGLTEQLQKNKRRLVIINNFGGQIFQRVFKNDLFVNQHQIQFKNWAQMWNWNYQLVTSIDDLEKIKASKILNLMIEIQPDAKQTQLFWDEWDQLCQKI